MPHQPTQASIPSMEEMLEEQLATGLAEYDRNRNSLFLSALTAGLEIGFSVFLMGVIYTMFKGVVQEPFLHFAVALSYPIGFLLVIIGRSELFTEHTNLALYPVFFGRRSIKQLLGLWGTILAGNLLGGAIIGSILVAVSTSMGVINVEAFQHLSHKMMQYSLPTIFGSAILAGWLMGLLSWMISASTSISSRILIIIIITAVIGLGGLHHSIVGSVELFCGWLSSNEPVLLRRLAVLAVTIIGNIIGGSFFVAALKFSHIKKA